MNLEFEDTLLMPTIAGEEWFGNSLWSSKGISNTISENYGKVLRKDEFTTILTLQIKLIIISPTIRL